MMWNTRRNAHSAPGASCTAGLHKPRFIRRAILPVCPHHIMGAIHLILGVSLLVTLFASNNAAAIATNEVEPETAPAQNPKLVTAARWKPRRKVGESCDPTWLCQQHKHIRCEHGVCTIYHSHNKKCGTRGYKCKNWLMCMNGKCRRRRDWWRSRWPGYVCLPLSRILERMLETSIFKTSSIGPVPMLNPCPFS